MSACILSAVILIFGQVVPPAVAQRIIIKLLTNENVKLTEILTRLRARFSDETLSKTQLYDWSKSFKDAKQRLKTCQDYAFCRERYGQSILGHSERLIHQLSVRTMSYQHSLLFESS
jgi:hypothetical protein